MYFTLADYCDPDTGVLIPHWEARTPPEISYVQVQLQQQQQQPPQNPRLSIILQMIIKMAGYSSLASAKAGKKPLTEVPLIYFDVATCPELVQQHIQSKQPIPNSEIEPYIEAIKNGGHAWKLMYDLIPKGKTQNGIEFFKEAILTDEAASNG